MSTRKDIAEVIGYLKLAFPNYSPDVTSPVNTVDVMFDLLGDVPAETLKLAVRAACAEPGRAFAPAVGEIREAAIKLSVSALGIPNEFEAWAEVCKMPKDRLRSRIEVDANGKMVTNENGAVIILEEKLKWSHALIEKTALLMGLNMSIRFMLKSGPGAFFPGISSRSQPDDGKCRGTASDSRVCSGTTRKCGAAVRAGIERASGADGEMKNFYAAKLDRRTEERVQKIVNLSRRRDRILEAPEMDLEALDNLAADYEAANLPSAAADLQRRLEHYRRKGEYFELVK